VHTLPFAIATGAVAPLAPALAYRLGTKIVVPGGLVLMAAGFFVAATCDVNTAYFGPVLISMVLIAVGLGFVAAPSTAAILAVLPPAKAGVGSAVNDVTRELGGAFGVAVVGAVFSSVYGPHLLDRLRGLNLTPTALGGASQSTADALKLAATAPGQVAGQIVHATQTSFIDGFSRGSIVCGVVVLLGAVFAFLVLPRRLPDVAALGEHAPEMEAVA
jgi:dipeptide/tripeptide permease